MLGKLRNLGHFISKNDCIFKLAEVLISQTCWNAFKLNTQFPFTREKNKGGKKEKELLSALFNNVV